MDGLWKEHAYVCGKTVLHLQSFVLKFLLKQVRTGRGHVEHCRDPTAFQSIPSGRVMRTAKKEEGEDFNWTTLVIKKDTIQWVFSKDIVSVIVSFIMILRFLITNLIVERSLSSGHNGLWFTESRIVWEHDRSVKAELWIKCREPVKST